MSLRAMADAVSEPVEHLTTAWRALVQDRNPNADVRDLPGIAVRWADCLFSLELHHADRGRDRDRPARPTLH